MKVINTSVSVDARKGVPRRIRRGRRIYTVRRVLDFWILQSRWWGSEEKRIYFRLETDGGVLEVYRGGTAGTQRREDAAAPAPGGHPPFIEGDTHTRELRQTESPYRPDAAALADRRQGKGSSAARRTGPTRPLWVLSRVMD